MVCSGHQDSKLAVHLLMEMVILRMGPRCFKEVLKKSSAEWLKECPLTSEDWKINLLYFHRFCLLVEHRNGGCDSDNSAGICHLLSLFLEVERFWIPHLFDFCLYAQMQACMFSLTVCAF